MLMLLRATDDDDARSDAVDEAVLMRGIKTDDQIVKSLANKEK